MRSLNHAGISYFYNENRILFYCLPRLAARVEVLGSTKFTLFPRTLTVPSTYSLCNHTQYTEQAFNQTAEANVTDVLFCGSVFSAVTVHGSSAFQQHISIASTYFSDWYRQSSLDYTTRLQKNVPEIPNKVKNRNWPHSPFRCDYMSVHCIKCPYAGYNFATNVLFFEGMRICDGWQIQWLHC